MTGIAFLLMLFAVAQDHQIHGNPLISIFYKVAITFTQMHGWFSIQTKKIICFLFYFFFFFWWPNYMRYTFKAIKAILIFNVMSFNYEFSYDCYHLILLNMIYSQWKQTKQCSIHTMGKKIMQSWCQTGSFW